jgi:hypothetical protein
VVGVFSFAENAVSQERIRGYFAPNATKAKQSSNEVYVDNPLQFLYPSALKQKVEDIKKRGVTLAEVVGEPALRTRRKRQIFYRDWSCSRVIGRPLVQAGQSGGA